MKKTTIDKLSIRKQHDVSNKNASDETGAIHGTFSATTLHMDHTTTKYHTSLHNSAFEQRLNDIAWPIKCHWAKYFPIRIVTSEHIDFAAINYEHVYIHPKLVTFDDDVLFCILAHEWAHRMVSPKSIEMRKKIICAVSKKLSISEQLAKLVSDPAVELIVDRSNNEIEQWKDSYCKGFCDSFNAFVEDLKKRQSSSEKRDQDILEVHQLMLALRIANISDDTLPSFIRHKENEARELINILFEDWNGCDDSADPNHINKITRFAKELYKHIPNTILKNEDLKLNLLQQLLQQLGELKTALIQLVQHDGQLGEGKQAGISIGNPQNTEHTVFDLKITRQVTNHLIKQAFRARQITGLWQPGHPISKLDVKRSYRCSPHFVAGVTTRRKTDSSRLQPTASGKKLRLSMIVDDSGSMRGDEAKYSRSICEGINRFSAILDRHIGLITFGGDVDTAIPPGRRYQQMTKSLAKLDGNLGGTNLLPALKTLLAHLEADREITHALLITDASFSDWNSCENPLNEILTQVNMTVLMINTDIPSEIIISLAERRQAISFFKVDPSVSHQTAILEEIIR